MKKLITHRSKTSRQKLIRANDRLFREIIKARDQVCQKTGRNTNLQVCHFWTRGNLRVRWDLDNACLLNAAQHIWWAHSHPEQFKEFWIRRLGQKKFDMLELKARYVSPVKEFDLLMISEELKKLRQLTQRR